MLYDFTDPRTEDDDIIAEPGDVLELRCGARGYPPPTVQILHDPELMILGYKPHPAIKPVMFLVVHLVRKSLCGRKQRQV